jgi:asparagine synthase (glutamine-hydrolysing)
VPGAGLLARTLIRALAPTLSRTHPKALGVLEHSGSWAGTYLLRRGLFLPHELPGVMDPDIAREGLYRLKPQHRLAATLVPDPKSDSSRVCLLESAHYMRNQLLRDTDWAGMAHSIEIRVPLVDFTLLGELAPTIPTLTYGVGKAALASAPSKPLPNEIVVRAKTGFGVPTGAWMNAAADQALGPSERAPMSKGIASRRWSSTVLSSVFHPNSQLQHT